MTINDFLKKPISDLSSEELLFLLESVSQEFKNRNSTLLKDKAPISVEAGIRFLTDMLQNSLKK